LRGRRRVLLGHRTDTSQREMVYGTPAGPPTMKIVVSSAIAGRRVDLLVG
jgi:hypothetical protein